MAKVKTHLIDPKEKYRIIGEFYEAVSGLKNKKEVIDFFIGLLTPSEALMMARRIQIAKLILEDKSYDEIKKESRVGTDTINKTDKWLNNSGEEYNKWIRKNFEGLKNKTTKKATTKNIDNLLDKYSHHRFLKELFS